MRDECPGEARFARRSRAPGVRGAVMIIMIASLVACNESTAPTLGNVRVIAATVGTALDPDGYTVTVDGTARGRVATNGALTVAGLSGGAHTMELGDVASNCTLSGDNPRSFAVTAGATVEVTFQIGCAPALGGA